MKEWFKKFFAVDNSVNEDTVIGCIFVIAFLVSCFIPTLASSRIPLGSAMAGFFGKNIFKKG